MLDGTHAPAVRLARVLEYLDPTGLGVFRRHRVFRPVLRDERVQLVVGVLGNETLHAGGDLGGVLHRLQRLLHAGIGGRHVDVATDRHRAFLVVEGDLHLGADDQLGKALLRCLDLGIILLEEDEHVAVGADNRMRLVLQPIVDSKTGEPKFYEALMRMAQPDGSVISAGEFVHVAEQLGLSRLIDRRTLELAVALLKQDTGLKLSLNVSGLTCGDQAWLAALQHLTGRDRQITSRLIVEITETAAIHDLNQSIAFVDTLKEIGCQVAIDDFGAGYTSFKNLKHLAVDMVKIDGGFVRNLPTDPSDRVFLETMVTLANSFGMETVAEWVGCEETAKIASDVGVTYLQGFHYGRPLAVEAVVNGGRDLVEPTDRAVEVAR